MHIKIDLNSGSGSSSSSSSSSSSGSYNFVYGKEYDYTNNYSSEKTKKSISIYIFIAFVICLIILIVPYLCESCTFKQQNVCHRGWVDYWNGVFDCIKNKINKINNNFFNCKLKCLNCKNKVLPTNDDIEDDDCVICMDNNNNNSIKISCQHKFHTKCILKWINTSIENNSQQILCPLCRAPI